MSGGIYFNLSGPAIALGMFLAGAQAAASPSPPPLAEADPVQSLVGKALEQNPSLKAQRERIKAAGQVPSQMKALPDPMADVEFMNLSVTRPDLKNALTEGISVGFTQPLPYPGKRGAAEAVALGEVEVERAKLRAMENELRTQVVAVAYRLVALRELLALNHETREALDAASQTAAAVYSSGMGSQADVLLAQSSATRTLARREELETQERIAKERLASLLGGSFEEESLAGVILPDPAPVAPLADYLSRLPASAPDVLMRQAEEVVGEKKVEVAKLAFKPDFNVGVRYRFRDMTMGGDDYLTAMFGITLPFFHRKDRYQPALQEALFTRESARYGTEDALNQSRYRLSEAYRGAERAGRLYHIFKEGLLAQASQAYESSMAGYGVGKLDFTSLLMALTQLYETQGDAVMAQADYQESVAMMEAVLGGPLVVPTVENSSPTGSHP